MGAQHMGRAIVAGVAMHIEGIMDFEVGVDLIDVPDNNLATLTLSNTGHLTVEYDGAMMILRHVDSGDATLGDLLA